MQQVVNVEIDWSKNATLTFNAIGIVVGSISKNGSGDDGVQFNRRGLDWCSAMILCNFLSPLMGQTLVADNTCTFYHTMKFCVDLWAEQNSSAFVEENEKGKCQSTSSNREDEKVCPPRESKHVDSSGVDC